MQQVHEVQKELADQFEHPEVHYFGFVVRKLREAMVKFRAGVDFETCVVSLPGLQLKARHTERPFNGGQFLVGRAFDIETPAPNLIGLGRERRQQRCEKLIAYGDPFCARDIFLIKWSRGPLAHAKKAATAAKPADIDAFRLSTDAPDQPRVIWVILRMNRSRSPQRNKVTRASVGFRAAILKIDIHFSDKVIFILRRLLKEELLPNSDLLGGRVLEPHHGIRLARCGELGKRRRGWLLNERADRCALG